MGEWIRSLFVSIFGTHSGLGTLFISMVPIVELRGAIPFGAATSLWGENALSLWGSFGYSVLGSSIICVILTFAFWYLFNFLKKTKGLKKIAGAIENRLNKKSANINKKTAEETSSKKKLWIKLIAVFGFVAIPLPLTGVWTGTCLALFIGLNKWQTLATVLSGNLIAGLLMTLISYFFADDTVIVLYIFLALVALVVVAGIIKLIVDKCRKKKEPVALAGGEVEPDMTIEASKNDEK